MNQHTVSELQAELAALRQRLGNVEVEHRELQRRAERTWRGTFSRKFLLSALSVVVLLAAAGLLAAQGGGDALFIGLNGNVGIRTNSPAESLEIAGTATQGARAIVSDGGGQDRRVILLEAPGKNDYGRIVAYKYGAGAGGRNLILQDTGGNVGIGTTEPSQRLHVAGGNGMVNNVFLGDVGHGPTWAGFANSKSVSKEGFGFLQDASGQNTLINKKSGGGSIGFRIDNTDKMVLADNGNVGIGTTDPKDKLDIAGPLRILTGSNPIRFTSGWSGFPDGVTNQAEISNDTESYKSLMIVGNKSGGGTTRRVQVHDQLEVRGDFFVTGRLAYQSGTGLWRQVYQERDGWAGSMATVAPVSSDQRFKSNVLLVPSALDKLRDLRGVTYRWNEAALRYFTRDIETTLSAGPNATAEENQKVWQAERNKRYKELANTLVGVVAQDVEAVLPEAVSTDEAGYKSVRYQYLIPLLIEALKEQDKTVKDQAQIVAQQQQEIARLAAANLAVQQQVADLAAVRTQVARLEATLHRGAAARSFVVPDAAARLSTAQAK